MYSFWNIILVVSINFLKLNEVHHIFYIKEKKFSLNTEPCGTPALITRIPEGKPSRRTLVYILIKNKLRNGQNIERS